MGLIIVFPKPHVLAKLVFRKAINDRYADTDNWEVSRKGHPIILIERRWVMGQRCDDGWMWMSGPKDGGQMVCSEEAHDSFEAARREAWSIVRPMIERERAEAQGFRYDDDEEDDGDAA